MSWFVIAVATLVAVAGAWWWLERPLFYRCESPDCLEDFLRDLVSEQSPCPHMEVHLRNRHILTFRRDRVSSGIFDLVLEFANGEAAPVVIGPTSSANLAPAAEAGRVALGRLGVAESSKLKIRYGGPMDEAVVVPAFRNLEHRSGPLVSRIARLGLRAFRASRRNNSS